MESLAPLPVLLAVGAILLALALPLLPRAAIALWNAAKLLQVLLAVKRKQRAVGRKTPHWTVVDDFLQACDLGPWDRVALVDVEGDRSLSYDEVDLLSDRVARWLLQKGFCCGDVLALFLPNSVEYICVWLGCAKAGVTAALLHSSFAGKGLRHAVLTALETTPAKRRYLVYGAGLAGKVVDAGLLDGPSVRLRCLVQQDGDQLAGLPSTAQVESVDGLLSLSADAALELPAGVAAEYSASEVADALSRGLPADGYERDGLRKQLRDLRLRESVRWSSTIFLIYTSGTTGLPKATKISHLRMWSAGALMRILAGLTRADGIYCALPLSHAAGGMLGIAGAFQAGCRFLVRSKLSVRSFAADCHRHEATVLQYIGEVARYLAHAPVTDLDQRLRLRVAMGNGLRPDVWPRFVARFRIARVCEFYAATEGNCNLVNNLNRVGAVGFVPPFLSPIYPVRLFRFDLAAEALLRCPRTGLCREARTGEPGQLLGLIRTDDPSRRFDGYTDAEATAKKIVRDVRRKGDAWFASGDLLRRDAWGFFYWVDRVGDTFRWKGENISTAQVAEVLTTCAAAPVRDANVYGVEVPHCDGRAGCARILPEEPSHALDFAALYRHLRTHLQMAGVPAFLRLASEGEAEGGESEHLTATFKHQKAELRDAGFDLAAAARAGDRLYVRSDAEATYVPLTVEGAEEIRRGDFNL